MTDLEELLTEQQYKIEHLENIIAQLVSAANNQNHAIEMLSKQVRMLAREAGLSIDLGFIQ